MFVLSPIVASSDVTERVLFALKFNVISPLFPFIGIVTENEPPFLLISNSGASPPAIASIKTLVEDSPSLQA